MAYRGDTVKFRVSSPNGTWCTRDTLEEAEAEIATLVNTYGVRWVAIDRIETKRILVRKMEEES